MMDRLASTSRRDAAWLASVLAVAVGLAACSKPKTPAAAAMARVGETWMKTRDVVKGAGPMAAVGMGTEMQGLFRDPAILGSELYANDAEYKRLADQAIELLGGLEMRLREGNAFEALADLQVIDNLCKQCHRGYAPGA